MITKASVLILVYSAVDGSTFDQLLNDWLPQISKTNSTIPIVIVGNKIDCRHEAVSDSELEARIAPILTQYKQVETCIESSAKEMINVAEIFYFALKSVLYPSSTLYDSSTHVQILLGVIF